MTAVKAFHARCLSSCVCARAVCQSSGPGSPGISPPHDGTQGIPGTRIYSPAAEAWHSLFRLLFLASMAWSRFFPRSFLSPKTIWFCFWAADPKTQSDSRPSQWWEEPSILCTSLFNFFFYFTSMEQFNRDSILILSLPLGRVKIGTKQWEGNVAGKEREMLWRGTRGCWQMQDGLMRTR